MSRIGKKPVFLPSGVEATVALGAVNVKGPKGALQTILHPQVTAKIEEVEGKKAIVFEVHEPEVKSNRALWGLFRSLVQNMIIGVTRGFEKKLEVNGIGFKAQATPKAIVLDVGFSHEVNFSLPTGIAATVDKNIITISGIDKQLVGEIAAQIRRIRKPEPYKGTGIKYVDEVIRRKAGKTATKAAA